MDALLQFLDTFEDGQDQQAVYEVFSALRGPDVVGPGMAYIKKVITGRLRTIVFGENALYGPITTKRKLTKTEIEQVKRIVRKWGDTPHGIPMSDSFYHYASHLASAVRRTRTHKIWGSPKLADELQVVLFCSTT